MINSLAVLLTCYNRRSKTLECLDNLFQLDLPESVKTIDVFLVDDGSTDGTSEAVKQKFPNVNVIQGTGDLFWNQGMRLAWNTAVAAKDYDFYLWLNDDVVLEKIALVELFECYNETLNKYASANIITGAFKAAANSDCFTYGGRNEKGNVIPNGSLQSCKYINGNAVLVSKEIYNVLGNLSERYTHGMGDFDYGLRALEVGFRNFTTKQYIGVCPVNEAPSWSNPKVPLKTRLELFRSPRGLNYGEYIEFRKRFWGLKWLMFAAKAYAKVLFPASYKKMKP